MWLVLGLFMLGLMALVLPPYLIWFNWWDKRMERQALLLFPDDDEEQQRATWQLLRHFEGPRVVRIFKIDISDFYARRHGKRPG